MSLIHNERTKYLATLVTTIAAAAIAAGAIAPMVALTYGMPGPLTGWFALFFGAVWLLTGATLHYLARLILGRLKE